MDLGKPVISTDTVGGSQEVIIENETGFCVNPYPQEVFSKIVYLLSNDLARIEMGLKGRERANTVFSFNKFGESFLSAYNNVLTNKNYSI